MSGAPKRPWAFHVEQAERALWRRASGVHVEQYAPVSLSLPASVSRGTLSTRLHLKPDCFFEAQWQNTTRFEDTAQLAAGAAASSRPWLIEASHGQLGADARLPLAGNPFPLGAAKQLPPTPEPKGG